jgi:hypothetical protein
MRQRLIRKGVTFTPDIAVLEIQGTTIKGLNVYSNALVASEKYIKENKGVREKKIERAVFHWYSGPVELLDKIRERVQLVEEGEPELEEEERVKEMSTIKRE